MSELSIVENDVTFDKKLSRPLELARNNSFEAQRMATDCAQLLSSSTNRLEKIKNQGFFKRTANRLFGKTKDIEQANMNDMHQLQKMAFRYLELVNKNNIMMLDSIITVKNQLDYILSDNIETKKAITKLAGKIKSKYNAMEKRIERIEITTAIHGWLLTIEEFEYIESYPKYIRLLKIVDDFRNLKSKDWTISDIRCLKNALRKTDIHPNETISIEGFVTSIANDNYPNKYSDTINGMLMMESVDVERVNSQLSLPLLSAMYQFADKYVTNTEVIERIVKIHPDIPERETAAKLILEIIKEHNVDITTEVEHQHLVLELLTGVDMAKYFASKKGFICPSANCILNKQKHKFIVPGFCNECGTSVILNERQ